MGQEAQHCLRQGVALEWNRTRSKIFCKVERTWIAWRDAACQQPYLVFVGRGQWTGPMETWCKLDLTARQAIWMEGWLLP